MDYASDPGRVFRSDTHRRVLGHLDPGREIRWGNQALLARMVPDVATSLGSVAEIEAVLTELEADGLAEFDYGWRMTAKGLELLTGPIADEPGPPERPLIRVEF